MDKKNNEPKKIKEKKRNSKNVKAIKGNTKKAFKIQTPGEKMDLEMNSFMNEVLQRIQMLEVYCFSLGNDLSIAITAMKALKNLMVRKKTITEKQFDKEFDKLYDDMLKVIKKSEEEAGPVMPGLTRDEIINLMNGPDVGHA